jgi:excisionase family DNA binding protein
MLNVHNEVTENTESNDKEKRWLYSKEEFCKLASISPTRFYEELKLGHLQGVKVGRSTRISHEEVQRWLASLAPYLPQNQRF